MTQFTIDLREPGGQVIGNRFSNMSFWHYYGTTPDERTWHEWAEEKPAGWVREQYPWIEEVQLFIATGGSCLGYEQQPGDDMHCEFDRDLFVNPADRATLDDYDFTPLVRACRNILRQGLRPCLKLHAVPLKFTARPKIGWFRVNVRPPDDHEVYYRYLRACVEALVKAFGLDEVRAWRWFVMTEMENRDWWQTEDDDGTHARAEFLMMYDYGVAALESVLGREHLQVGAHAMMVPAEYAYWDAAAILHHCVGGTNHKTGETGTKLDFFALSYYDRSPGHIEHDALNTQLPSGAWLGTFREKIDYTRARLAEAGLPHLPLEISEGGLLFGMDGKWLWHGLATGGSFDASWTALCLHELLDTDLGIWSRWPCVRTGGLFHGVEVASTHLLRLVHKMAGGRRVTVKTDAGRAGEPGILDAIAAWDADEKVCRVLVFYHGKDVTESMPPRPVRLALEGMGDRVGAGRVWRIEAEHGDFWPLWEKDRAAHGISDDDYRHSRDQADVSHALQNDAARAYWHSREDAYAEASRMQPQPLRELQQLDGTLVIDAEMPCWSVRLYEFATDGLRAS
jgi:xylan 1,4-beta-xylosidase